MHIKTPKSIDAHRGPLALQSAHYELSSQLARILSNNFSYSFSESLALLYIIIR